MIRLLGFALDALPPGTLIELAARAPAVPGSPAPEGEPSATVTVLETSDLPTAPDLGVRAPSDMPGVAPPFVMPLSEVDVAFVGPAGSALHAVGARAMTYDNAPFGLPEPEALLANESAHQVSGSWGNLRQVVSAAEALEAQAAEARVLAGALMREGEGGRQARGTDGDFTLYVGYTLQEYLAEKSRLGLEPGVDDSGSALTPVADDDGQVVDFLIDTWRIADTPGTYIPILLVPEPGAAGMLAVGGLVLAATARRRRGH